MFVRYQQVGRILEFIQPKTIVEVGTWNGDHAIIIATIALRYHTHVHYWGFDLFEDADEQTDDFEFNVRSHHSLEQVAAKLAVFQNENPGFSFELFRGNSSITLRERKNDSWSDPVSGEQHVLGSSAFAYIDGGHSIETVRRDYENLQQCETIIFDDYYQQDELSDGPDTSIVGCNDLLKALPHILLPARDQLPSGGFVRMAATGPGIMAYAKEDPPTLEANYPPPKRAVVTTFSPAGYYEYGREFITSFDKYWPEDIDLLVYTDIPMNLELSPRVKELNFPVLSPEMVAFKSRHHGIPRSNGIDNDTGLEDYRFNAVKFCHKVFALTHAGLNCGADVLYWIDADSVTFRAVSHTFLDTLLPAGYYTSYLGRRECHSECGFMAFDLRSQQSAEFMRFFNQLYDEDQVFELPEWHDSYVYDVIRQTFEAKNIFRSYNLRAANEDDHHPFVNSPLGSVMDHLIGPRRKLAGCSFSLDLRSPQDEFYWKTVPIIAEDLIEVAQAQLAGKTSIE